MTRNFYSIIEYVTAMDMLSETIIAASVVAAIVSVAATLFVTRASTHRARRSELRLVQKALTEHFAAVERLTDDPAVPDRLKLLLLSFSEAISSRQVSIEFADALANGRFNLPQSKEEMKRNPFFEDMEKIRASRQDLVQEMDRAIKSGLIAIIFRWPESAAVFNQIASQTLDTKNEIAAFAKISQLAAKITAKNGDSSGFPPDGVGAHC